MLFNSIEFAIFFPFTFVLYWFVFQKSFRLQNIFIALASYFFYGWWDWRFLSLLLFSTAIDFLVALSMDATENKDNRKLLLYVSLIANLGLLGFFKYYNFFIDSFVDAFTFFGQEFQFSRLKIILPVGISFYTFQTLSYTIDVYRGNLKASNNFFSFCSYVSFFPQLVAGPIERATNLLPQFETPRSFDYQKGVSGMRLILWGLFKKIVIGDTTAIFANQIFANYENESGIHLFLGVIYFAFQIYADFSGYSDIARGSARLFGFELMVNFNYPYFSRDIAEFWRKWHISLSTWFRDYVYIPLGGSHGPKSRGVLNIVIVFFLSGFWHGANWTFIVWGLLNALYFVPLFLLRNSRKNPDLIVKNSFLAGIIDFAKIAFTFGLTLIAWVFFRSPTLTDALYYLQAMFSISLLEFPTLYLKYIPIIVVFVIWEWLFRNKECGLGFTTDSPKIVRWSLYFITICAILFFIGEEKEFIYFQF